MRNPAGAASALAIAAFLLAAALTPAVAQAPATPALAPAQTGGTIDEIRIEGMQRVEPETVRSYLQVAPGDAFSSDRLDQSLKSLFATKPTAEQAAQAAVNFGQDDDITVLTLTRVEASEESTAPQVDAILAPA